MQNIKLMEKTLPAAPLKIAALESCRQFGRTVDNYIVGFRQDTLKETQDSPLYQSYRQDTYLVDCNVPASAPVKPKDLSKNPSAATTCLLWSTLPTIMRRIRSADMPTTNRRMTIIRI